MKTSKTTFFSMLLLVIVMLCAAGCKKKEEGKVTVTTKSVAEITANSAKCGGNVIATGNATAGVCGVCWSETPNPTTNDFFTTDIVGLGEYISVMNNLRTSTKYFVRAYATLSSGVVMYGEEKDFTTLSDGGGNGGGGNGGGNGGGEGTITVTTNDVTEITASSATCGGNVTVNGEVTITAKGVCYSTSHTPTLEGAHTSDGQGVGSFTSHMTELSENTTYYVRAYAQTVLDIVYGEEVGFTTSTAAHSTIQVTDITHNSIKIKVTPAPNVAYYYSKIVGVGNAVRHEVSETLLTFNSLTPETQYHFEFTFYGSNHNLLDTKTTSATTSEQPYVAPTVTVTLINVSPTYLELKFEPSSNTSYYCYNIGGNLTSTTHVTGVTTKKFSNYQSHSFQPDTEYEFSVVAYDANGTAGEVIHPKFTTNPAPYSSYFRQGDNFYPAYSAQITTETLANGFGQKVLFIRGDSNRWIKINYLCYTYELDNVWYSGTYAFNGGTHGYSCDYRIRWDYIMGFGGGSFTITKSGNYITIDVESETDVVWAHFSGTVTN